MSKQRNVVKSLAAAFDAKDGELVAKLLEDLYGAESTDWVALLFVNGVIPHPSNPKTEEYIETLTRTAGELLTHPTALLLPFLEFYASLSHLFEAFRAARGVLEELPIWDRPVGETIFRIASFLEDQEHIRLEIATAYQQQQGAVFISNLAADVVPTLMGGPRANLAAGFEENSENLQLIAAYAPHRHNALLQFDTSVVASPYDDSELAQLLYLATIWRKYNALWERILFFGWRSETVTADDGSSGHYYRPIDYSDYFNYRTAAIRAVNLSLDISVGVSFAREHASTDAMVQLVNSLDLPKAGKLWNGAVDFHAWRSATDNDSSAEILGLKAELMHFGSLVDQVKVEHRGDAISWPVHATIVGALRVLAMAFFQAHEGRRTSNTGSLELEAVVLIRKADLVSQLAQVTTLDQQLCMTSLNALLFDMSLKELEIWDMPLMPMGDDTVLFIPSLFWYGNPLRLLENTIAQWKPNQSLFTRRGKLLEVWLSDVLQKIDGVSVQQPVEFQARTGQRVECDLVVLWNNHLILIEAKCTRSITSPANYWQSKRKLGEAVEQLKIREELIRNNWAAFKAAANRLDLAAIVPNDCPIHLIAVTNVLDFTGASKDNVVITDQFCLSRFFGEQHISVVLHQNGEEEVLGSIGTVRPSATPTVDEFLIYLADPPQVKLVQECLVPARVLIPYIDETSPKLAYFHAEYIPTPE